MVAGDVDYGATPISKETENSTAIGDVAGEDGSTPRNSGNLLSKNSRCKSDANCMRIWCPLRQSPALLGRAGHASVRKFTKACGEMRPVSCTSLPRGCTVKCRQEKPAQLGAFIDHSRMPNGAPGSSEFIRALACIGCGPASGCIDTWRCTACGRGPTQWKSRRSKHKAFNIHPQ